MGLGTLGCFESWGLGFWVRRGGGQAQQKHNSTTSEVGRFDSAALVVKSKPSKCFVWLCCTSVSCGAKPRVTAFTVAFFHCS